MNISKKLFTIDKFILGVNRLNIPHPMKLVRQLFKPYNPSINKEVFGMRIEVDRVVACNAAPARDHDRPEFP